ncbi:hypothetical protein D1B33_14510 [Lysinibacillus yapensis]|uniref:Uncharacterized protein n=2 Tax=Ureibacillus yapensis TaxID=2304605 RepID=A0A396S4T7_9BACL|nr:hypothetical protein D1B33_14510 [Lysinibacillus yapensis]
MNFLLSTLIIWIYLFIIIIYIGITDANRVWELLFFAAVFLPIFLLFAVVLPILNIYLVNRKKKAVYGLVIAYFFAAWLLFYLVLEVLSGTATWLENRLLYGKQVDEAKIELLQEAEQSIEARYNREFQLMESIYSDEDRFLRVRYFLQYKDESCLNDCDLIAFSLSYEKEGWRLKRLAPTDIWYLESN